MTDRRAQEETDIRARNAGIPCLTIWGDGGFVHHGMRDAEIATLSEPSAVLLTIRLDTLEAVVFRSPQERVALYEKILGVRHD